MLTLHENIALIEFDDAMTLQEVRAATILDQHLVEQISDTAVVVDHRTLAALLQNLRRKGYTPKVSGFDGG